MEYARKMVLVPEDKVARHIPTDEFLSDLDKEMKRILLSKESDDVKIKLYNSALNKRIQSPMLNPPRQELQELNNTKKQLKIKTEVNTEEPFKKSKKAEDSEKSSKSESKDFVEELVIHTVPQNMKNTA